MEGKKFKDSGIFLNEKLQQWETALFLSKYERLKIFKIENIWHKRP